MNGIIITLTAKLFLPLHLVFLVFPLTLKAQPPLTKEDLVGIWQDLPSMAAGWSNRYQFYPSGKYAFMTSEMDCESKQRGEIGRWRLDGHTLWLTVEKVVTSAQKPKRILESCEGLEKLKVQNAKDVKAVKMPLRPNPNQPEPNFHYPSLFIDKKAYWRFNDPLRENPPFAPALPSCGVEREPC